MLGREPRQARKGAAVVSDAGAGVASQLLIAMITCPKGMKRNYGHHFHITLQLMSDVESNLKSSSNHEPSSAGKKMASQDVFRDHGSSPCRESPTIRST